MRAPGNGDEGDSHGEDDHRDDCEGYQVFSADAQRIAEEDRRQVAGERVGLRDQDHAQAQHPHEQEADAGVLGESGLAVDEVDAPDHHNGSEHRADEDVEVEDDGDGDARDDTMHQGVAEEGHPRITTQVPTRDKARAARTPARRGPLLEGQLEGLLNQSITPTLPGSSQRLRDSPGIGQEHLGQCLRPRSRRAQGLGEQLDDFNIIAQLGGHRIGEGRRLVVSAKIDLVPDCSMTSTSARSAEEGSASVEPPGITTPSTSNP